MIYNYPYFGFPNYLSSTAHLNKSPYLNIPYSANSIKHTMNTHYTNNSNNPNDYNRPDTFNNVNNYNKSNKSNNNNAFNNYTNAKKSKSSNEYPILFDIMGIKLHYDDILLGCMILFLYNENIHDSYLLISLVLLLLG